MFTKNFTSFAKNAKKISLIKEVSLSLPADDAKGDDDDDDDNDNNDGNDSNDGNDNNDGNDMSVDISARG